MAQQQMEPPGRAQKGMGKHGMEQEDMVLSETNKQTNAGQMGDEARAQQYLKSEKDKLNSIMAASKQGGRQGPEIEDLKPSQKVI